MAAAFCNRRGEIRVGQIVLRGWLVLAFGKPKDLHRALECAERVPGVPEAGSDTELKAAVRRFRARMAQNPQITIPDNL